MMNPYWGKGFFGVIGLFIQRMCGLITGNIPFSELASDEMQIMLLALLGISCALVGTFLVLRRMVMLANSVSHTILVGLVVPFYFMHYFAMSDPTTTLTINMQVLFFAALITALITMFFTDFLTRVLRIQADASIGLVFTFLFAVGITTLTILTRNSHIGTEIIMGNVDMLHRTDLLLVGGVALLNLALIVAFFKELVISSFDPMQSKLSKISHFGMSYLLMFITSLTVISGFRAVGVVLVLSFLVVPPLTARLWVNRIPAILVVSSLVSVLSAVVSVALSRHLVTAFSLNLSTAGLVVVVQFCFYLFSIVFSPKSGLSTSWLKEKQDPKEETIKES